MQEIADKAEINKGLLHYYYKSKEKLFSTVFNFALKQMLEKLNEALIEDNDLFTKIERLVDNYITVLSKNIFIPNFVFQEINRNPEFFNKNFKTLNELKGIGKFEKQIEAEIKKGNIINIDSKQLLINIISLSIFPFIAKPMVKGILSISEKEFNNIIEERKKEVAEFTINSIKKVA
jgi:AcrR family transcriptional regulator